MNLHVDVALAPTFPRLLSRAQLAQKVGAARYSYPRPDGVLVALPLREIGTLRLLIGQDRSELGRVVIVEVARSMRHLPPKLLDLVVPHPNVVLRDLPIEARTRSVLERFLPTIARQPVWTVARYLGIPKFGARCLVDLLAACEESARDDGARDTPGAVRPIAGAAPLRSITCGGRQLALARAPRDLAATVVATAVHMVSHWGLSTVESVIERVSVLRSAPADETVVRRLLAALPRLRWLDAARNWFSCLGDASRLARGVAQVFTVARRVPFRELRRALAKGQPRAPDVPKPVLQQYLRQIAGCQIEGALVVGTATVTPARLADDEAVLVELLASAPSDLQVRALGAAAAAHAIPPARVDRLVRRSPLFVRTRRHHVRLIGHGNDGAARVL